MEGPEPAEQEDDSLPSVTVVIACRNEPLEVVQMTLSSALNLRYPRHKLAFIIADNSDEHHPDFLALCGDVEARQRRGEPIEMLHRYGTQGFKAGNLDMAVQAARSDLLLFLDVDNTVPDDLLLAHAAPLWLDRESAYRQCFHIASNGHVNLLAATAASAIGWSKYHDLSLSLFSGWSLFQGHACLWKRQVLLNVAPLSQYLKGKGILTEDLSITMQVARTGLLGQTYRSPTAFWVPHALEDMEKMIGRWSLGVLQCYIKNRQSILDRAMGYKSAGGYAALWYRLWRSHFAWVLPVLALLLPFSWGGSGVIACLWVVTGLLPSLLIMGCKDDANIARVRPGCMELLRLHLLFLFQAWSVFRGVISCVAPGPSGWSQTPKLAPGQTRQHSWLNRYGRFGLPLLFSFLVAGFSLAWKGLLFREPLLSPATLPALYLSGGVVAAIVLFALPRQAPASSVLRQRLLPSWMGCSAGSSSRQQG